MGWSGCLTLRKKYVEPFENYSLQIKAKNQLGNIFLAWRSPICIGAGLSLKLPGTKSVYPQVVTYEVVQQLLR